MVTITKGNIRRGALASGQFSLESEQSRMELEKYVGAYYSWYRSDVWRRFGIEAVTDGPMALLAKVQSPSNMMRERFVFLVLKAIEDHNPVYFFGPGSRYAALAFAKQVVFDRVCGAHYWDLPYLVALEERPPLDPEAVLILELYPPGNGRLWVEKTSMLMDILRQHRGPKILVHPENDRQPADGFGALVYKTWVGDHAYYLESQ